MGPEKSSTNHPPGVTGCEPTIVGDRDLDDLVFDRLNQCRKGESLRVLARVLRRTRTSDIYGVVKEDEDAVVR